jgi:hypothetical protein
LFLKYPNLLRYLPATQALILANEIKYEAKTIQCELLKAQCDAIRLSRSILLFLWGQTQQYQQYQRHQHHQVSVWLWLLLRCWTWCHLLCQ